MRAVRTFTGSVVVALLWAAAPQPVHSQEVGLTLRRDLRPGTQLSGPQLGELLANTLMIGETEKNLAGSFGERAASRGRAYLLRVRLVSREGVLASYSSEAVATDPRERSDASRWIPRPRELGETLVAPLKPAEFVIFRIGQFTIEGPVRGSVPRVCEDATHALLIALEPNARNSGDSGTGKTMALCLNVGT